MTVRLTGEEVQELERRHQENRTPIAHVGTGFCVACEADWPCPTARLVAERREREATLAELERELDSRTNSSSWALSALGIAERDRKRAEAAEAKLASLAQCLTCCGQPHVSGLRCICNRSVPNVTIGTEWIIHHLTEALADPPRTAGGTDPHRYRCLFCSFTAALCHHDQCADCGQGKNAHAAPTTGETT